MNREEKQIECSKLLVFIYQEYDKEITPDLIDYWLIGLAGKNKDKCWRAARYLAKQKTYGEPRLQDFEDAYQVLRQAERVKPPEYSPHRAHDDVLQQEQQWLALRQAKEFIERYEQGQERERLPRPEQQTLLGISG